VICVLQNRHTVAGAAARTMAQCTVHPIDTVKTRMQVRARVRFCHFWSTLVTFHRSNFLILHPWPMYTASSTLKAFRSDSTVRGYSFCCLYRQTHVAMQISRPHVARLTEWKAAASKVHVWLQHKGRPIICSRNFAPFGVRDLYRGVTGSLLGTAPVALAYFCVYESTALLDTSYDT
jgi:Mitochondrial carrier protein